MNRWLNIYTDAGDGTDRMVADSLLSTVLTGTHTFGFSGSRYSGQGTLRLYSPGMVVLTPNSRPTLSPIGPQSAKPGIACAPIGMTVRDGNTPASLLTISLQSSNPALVPPSSAVVGGAGFTRTLTLTPSGMRSGSALITVTVSDGLVTSSQAFTLTVEPDFKLRLPLARK